MTSSSRLWVCFLFWLGLPGLSCGPDQERPPSNGTFRFVGASLLDGPEHSEVLCSGDFRLSLQGEESERQLLPEGRASCEAPSKPGFQVDFGGDCELVPIKLLAVDGSLRAESPRLGCEEVSTEASVELVPLSQGFALLTASRSDLRAEYIFERLP